MILFVGYQSAGTLGRLLVDGVDHVKLFDETIEVKAQIDTLPGISGHADECLNQELGYHAYAPYSGCRFDLLAGQFEKMPEGKPISKPGGGKQRKVSAAYTRMVAAAERLLQIAKSIEGRANRELASYADAITKLADKMEK